MHYLKSIKLIITVIVIVIYTVIYILTTNDKKSDLNNIFLIEANNLKKKL